MANNNRECIGCPYNTPKTQGGYGKTCNGYTMEEEGRCPEWRINEIREKKEKAVKEK
ncbi:unnamed protein product [marine sediment metagenome]|uniref:Uncharacterized protein n=1 Tax=marine sediment metagenome TaxID=412755 RepID=X1L3J3_9ZZZZ